MLSIVKKIDTVIGRSNCLAIIPRSSDDRLAKCKLTQCAVWSLSHPELPFFERQVDMPHDLYYCGCLGWD